MKSLRRCLGLPERARSGARIAALVLAFVALALQAFVVQTHFHTTVVASAQCQLSSATSAPGDQAPEITLEHHQGACALCLAFAAGGRGVLAAVGDGTVLAARIVDPIVESLHAAADSFAHAWQSRAPPIAL